MNLNVAIVKKTLVFPYSHISIEYVDKVPIKCALWYGQ